MNRFLTWPLIVLVIWCGYLLHLISVATNHPATHKLALFLLIVAIPVALGVWYGTSIRTQEVK